MSGWIIPRMRHGRIHGRTRLPMEFQRRCRFAARRPSCQVMRAGREMVWSGSMTPTARTARHTPRTVVPAGARCLFARRRTLRAKSQSAMAMTLSGAEAGLGARVSALATCDARTESRAPRRSALAMCSFRAKRDEAAAGSRCANGVARSQAGDARSGSRAPSPHSQSWEHECPRSRCATPRGAR